MKKILISILLILSALLTYFAVVKHISFFGWRSNNFADVKDEKINLDNQINVAKQINNQEYLRVVTLPNTKNILTMYPINNKYDVIDDDYMEEIEHTKVKKLTIK